jgi:hypothetical protein
MRKEMKVTFDQVIVQLVNYEAQRVALLQQQDEIDVQYPHIEAEHFYDLDAVAYGLM